jgi:glutamate-5-semialdehyde dehydrogenase
MARLLAAHRADLCAANQADRDTARGNGVPAATLNRLVFDEAKVDSRVRALEMIAELPDPVGQIYRSSLRPNGLLAARVRVPLGVILMVYEARPHVTVNAGALCLKSGNAAILRGGTEAQRCNALLGRLWQQALQEAGLPADAVQVIAGSHDDVAALLQRTDDIDLVIPRGGHTLIEAVATQSRIPVIKHFAGVCHVYVDEGADADMAARIAVDSKCLMPEVCNAAETLLVHTANTGALRRAADALAEAGVTLHGCPRTRELIDAGPATEEDWSTEYLDLAMSVRIVDSLDEAIAHINTYGSHHTDTIVTDSIARARAFVRQVDSGVVLTNASTMFCDGATLGMGAEIGISTDKLHARGPMGLEELTTYKHVIHGDGQTMGDMD